MKRDETASLKLYVQCRWNASSLLSSAKILTEEFKLYLTCASAPDCWETECPATVFAGVLRHRNAHTASPLVFLPCGKIWNRYVQMLNASNLYQTDPTSFHTSFRLLMKCCSSLTARLSRNFWKEILMATRKAPLLIKWNRWAKPSVCTLSNLSHSLTLVGYALLSRLRSLFIKEKDTKKGNVPLIRHKRRFTICLFYFVLHVPNAIHTSQS